MHAEGVWLRSPAVPQVSLRIPRARCHPPRLPRDLEPGLDGGGRAADSGTGERSLRHCARRRRRQLATRCAVLARLRGGQAGADRDRHRHVGGLHRFGRGRPGQEDLRQPGRQERLPGWRGQDVRTRRPAPAGARREEDLRRQSHLRARRGAGQEVQWRSHPLRSALRHRRSRRHRHQLHRSAAHHLPQGARREVPEPPPQPSDVLHRHRGSARRRSGDEQARRHLRVRHRRSAAGRGVAHLRPPRGSRSRRSHRATRSRQVPGAAADARRRSDHRLAAGASGDGSPGGNRSRARTAGHADSRAGVGGRSAVPRHHQQNHAYTDYHS